MKRFHFFVIASLLLVSCGGNNNKNSADSDSITEAAILEAVEAVRNANPYITKDSVGSVLIGAEMNSIPDSIPGLYSHKTNGASPDAVTVTFSDAAGEQFIAYDFGEGNIDVITLIGNKVKVNAPDGDFGLGDPFTNVLNLPDVKAEWISYDDNGSWFWTCNGLWFAPADSGLTQELSQSLYNPDSAPDPAAFGESVKIGFIGTGLPF